MKVSEHKSILEEIEEIQQDFIKKLGDTGLGSVAFDILLSEQRSRLYELFRSRIKN